MGNPFGFFNNQRAPEIQKILRNIEVNNLWKTKAELAGALPLLLKSI
jgi:hypothetical protein